MMEGPAPRGIRTFFVFSSGPSAASIERPSNTPPPITVTSRAMKNSTQRKKLSTTSASDDQAGPTIRQALVPPKPKELLSA